MPTDLTTLKQKLIQLKSHQKATSAKFKQVAMDSPERDELLSTMKEISSEIRSLEQELLPQKACSHPPTPASQPTKTENPFPIIDPKNIFIKGFTTSLISKEEFHSWDTFLESTPHCPYSNSTWFNIVKKSFGHETCILIARDENLKILGGLPLTFFSSKIFGQFAVSIPFINYGGIVSRYWNVAQSILEASRDLLATHKLSHIEVRSLHKGFDAPFQDKKASLILPLPRTMAELNSQWNAKLRAQCKKAENFSPILAEGKLELLDQFYDVFSRNMRDLGTPVYSKNFFRNILTSPLNSFILVVSIENRPVSCGFFIANNDTLEIPWASTIESANIYNTNMYLYREALRIAIEKGFNFFDFGRSTINAGTYKFKRQWGAEPVQHYWYYLLPDEGKLPNLNPDNPKYKLFIKLWKLLPIWVSKLIGPAIIRNLP
jgi:serine/alanine adding enzyme